MKSLITSLAVAYAIVFAAQAEDMTAKISDTHMCCKKCVQLSEKTVAAVPNAKAVSDKDARTITITAPDKATLQKATDALVAAGFYGTSSDVKIESMTGAKNEKMKTLQINDIHVCCGSCVDAINDALSAVPGVTGNTATKGVDSFTVTGDFNDQAVFDALQKKGLTGKEGK